MRQKKQKRGADAAASDSAATGNELIAIPSDDEQTTFTLFDNGTYESISQAMM